MPKGQKAGQQETRTPRERVRVLITGGRIQRRIQALANEIRNDFPGEPLHLISVLKGGVFFLTDLARNIPGEVSFDFIAVSSYGEKTHSSGQVRLTRDLDSSIEGKTVIVVEDISSSASRSICAWRCCWTSRNGGSPRYTPTTLDFQFPMNLWSVMGWITPNVTETCPTLACSCSVPD